jgi:hypothetical protein
MPTTRFSVAARSGLNSSPHRPTTPSCSLRRALAGRKTPPLQAAKCSCLATQQRAGGGILFSIGIASAEVPSG